MCVGTAPLRGMKDMFPDSTAFYRYIERVFTRVVEESGYGEVRTPVLEAKEVFCETLGETSDVVSKQMYAFDDNGTPVVMRPENTAAVTRAIVRRGHPAPAQGNNPSAGKGKGGKQGAPASASASVPATAPAVVVAAADPALTALEFSNRLYYHGPMFRRERPQAGRLRQFEQFGVECLHSAHPLDDAQVIQLAHRALSALRLAPHVELRVNSVGTVADRAAYHAALTAYLTPYAHLLSTESQRRVEAGAPFRVLDSKHVADIAVVRGVDACAREGIGLPPALLEALRSGVPPPPQPAHASAAAGAGAEGGEGEEEGELEAAPARAPVTAAPDCYPGLPRGAPSVLGSLSGESLARHEAVLAGLQLLRVPFTLDPLLFRGLDYYAHTAFEFVVRDGSVAKAAVLAGGRYDGLALRFGDKPVPAIGWAAGVDRIFLQLQARGLLPALPAAVDVAVVAMAAVKGDHAKPSPGAAASGDAGEAATSSSSSVSAGDIDVAALCVADELRRLGARAAFSPSLPFRTQIADGASKGARFAVLLGGAEVAAGTVTVRDLAARTQLTLPREGLAAWVREHGVGNSIFEEDCRAGAPEQEGPGKG